MKTVAMEGSVNKTTQHLPLDIQPTIVYVPTDTLVPNALVTVRCNVRMEESVDASQMILGMNICTDWIRILIITNASAEVNTPACTAM